MGGQTGITITQLRRGMEVRSADGTKLGTIAAV
jgi:hypothetical protein